LPESRPVVFWLSPGKRRFEGPTALPDHPIDLVGAACPSFPPRRAADSRSSRKPRPISAE